MTFCTANRQTLFNDPHMAEIAAVMWEHIPQRPHAAGVVLDEWVLMPNHLHGLLFLPDTTSSNERDVSDPAVLPGLPFDMHYAAQPDSIPEKGGRRRLPAGSLGAIVGGYKSSVSRRINAMRGTPGHPIWQRGYYEHIVRNERELERIRTYIRENPARWVEGRDDLDRLIDRMTHHE